MVIGNMNLGNERLDNLKNREIRVADENQLKIDDFFRSSSVEPDDQDTLEEGQRKIREFFTIIEE